MESILLTSFPMYKEDFKLQEKGDNIEKGEK